MPRNQLLSLATLLTTFVLASSTYAQSSSSPIYSASGYRSNYAQGYTVNKTAVSSVGQTCANGSCSMRSTPSPVVTSASQPTTSYSVAQNPITKVASQPVYSQPIYSQPVYRPYYPTASPAYYSSQPIQYSSQQRISSVPTSSYYGTTISYGSSCR